jgi:hypothetical protein
MRSARYRAPMILRRTRLLALALPLVGLVALAGPAAAGESRSDKAILEAGVITKDDVPAGWTSKKGSSSDRAFKGIAECKEIKAAVDRAKKNEPRARSRDFEERGSRGTTAAENTVYVFRDTIEASDFMANYQAPEAATCFEKGIAKVLSSEQGAGEPSVAPITDLQGVGDDAVGYEITIPFRASGETATLYFDLVAVRVGRAFLGFNFADLSERLPDAPAIVQAVVARVSETEGST